MRAYFLPVKKWISRVAPQPIGIRSFMYRRRAHVYIMVAMFLMLTTVGFVSVRALVAAQPEQEDNNTAATKEVKAEGANVTTTYQSSASGPDATTGSSSNASSDTKTSVTVNNQQIPVPKNGSVSKTITNENGTTKVDISSHSTSSGQSSSTSVNSTSLNVSAESSSSDVKIDNSME